LKTLEPPAGIEPATCLITKFRVSVYAIDPIFGVCLCKLAIPAWSARIEPDFEPNFAETLAFCGPSSVATLKPNFGIADN
jgi:hypothetical protein